MNHQSVLRSLIQNLPQEESVAALQERLNAAGINTNLSSLPAASVSKTFVSELSTFLERPVGELTIDEIRALTAAVEIRGMALEEDRPHQEFSLHVEKRGEVMRTWFVLNAGQSLLEALTLASESYERNASEEQKARIRTLVSPAFEPDDYFVTPLDRETTFQIDILLKRPDKCRVDVYHPRDHTFKTIGKDERASLERAMLTVLIALQIDRSVAEGVLIVPGEGLGELIQGNSLSTRKGTVVSVSAEGIGDNFG